MKSIKLLAALAVLTSPLVLSGTADAGRFACRSDFKKYCSAVEPGTGEAVACMRKHFDELSDGCKEYIKEAKAEKDAREAAAHQE